MSESADRIGPRVRHFSGRRVVMDAEDFLSDPDDWSEDLARELARESGLAELDGEHWRVLRFFRDFYFTQGRGPLNKEIRTGLGRSLQDLEGLFPGGIRNGARRLAGLPNPKTCM